MPNYIYNIVTADLETLERIKSDFTGYDSDGNYEVLTLNAIIPMPEHIFRGNIGAEEEEKYGKDNWYDWCRKNWGTKWDAWESAAHDQCISFITAWSPPTPIYKELANRGYNFTIYFIDEGDSCAWVGTFINGNLVRNDIINIVEWNAICKLYCVCYEREDDEHEEQ